MCMNIKKVTLVVVALLLCVGTYAQQSKTDASVEFRPHWNLQLQGGAAYTIGESSSFGDQISPALFLSTNYRFHHAMALRLGLGGWQAKGVVVSPEMGYSFNFVQLNADMKFDLSSFIGGFNHRRVCSVYAFAGVGGIYGFDNDKATKIVEATSTDELEYLWDSKAFVAGRFGLGLDFRASDRVSLSLEGNANVLSDHFNSKRADNCDWQFNLLAGVAVNFGKNHRTSQAYLDAQAAEQAARLAAEREAAERARLEAEQAAKEQAEREAAEKAAEEKAAAAAEAQRLAKERADLAAAHSDNIFFLIGSADIRRAEAEKLNAVAEWMNSNGDFKVAVVGYADKETGNAKSNAELSERRAESVKRYLVKAGVAEERIETSFHGDTVQPFDESSKNRVVICTLE